MRRFGGAGGLVRATVPPIVIAALIAACGASGVDAPGNHGPYPFTNIPAPVNGVAQFSVLPVSIAPGATLTALGSLNPPGHVVPTDHVYFYDWNLSGGQTSAGDVRTVYMPATAAVFQLLHPSGNADTKIMCRVTGNFYFYLDHVVPTIALTVGQVIQAGTIIGTTTPGSTVDLGAFDMSSSHAGFLNAARYPVQTQYYVSPWKYFTPALQAEIYPHVYRAPTAPDSDGKIDFGVAGKLVGDWFLQGMLPDSSFAPYGWTRTVSFAYDYYDPSLVRISIGGTVAPAGVWGIDSSAPPPATVSVSSGVVPYRLYTIHDAPTQYGLMLVQMTDSVTIKIEIFVGNKGATAQFDGNAFTFIR